MPQTSVPHFAVLGELLDRAGRAAAAGDLMGLPTQPEMVEMRRWLCGEVCEQEELAPPTRRCTQIDPVVLLSDTPRTLASELLASRGSAQIATDATSVIIAIPPSALDVVGSRKEASYTGGAACSLSFPRASTRRTSPEPR